MLISSLFHESILKENNLFPLMKCIVPSVETKCFDCYYTCETTVSFLRRYHQSESKICSALSEFPSALWCSQAEGLRVRYFVASVSQRANCFYSKDHSKFVVMRA